MNRLSQSCTLTLCGCRPCSEKERSLNPGSDPAGKQASSLGTTVLEIQHVMHTSWTECPSVSHFLLWVSPRAFQVLEFCAIPLF